MFFNFFLKRVFVKTTILSVLAFGIFTNCNNCNDKPANKANTKTTSVSLKDHVK